MTYKSSFKKTQSIHNTYTKLNDLGGTTAQTVDSSNLEELQKNANQSESVMQQMSLQYIADRQSIINHTQPIQLDRSDYNNGETRTDKQEAAHKSVYGQATTTGGKLYIGRMRANQDENDQIKGDGTMGTMEKKQSEINTLNEKLKNTNDEGLISKIKALIHEKEISIARTLSVKDWTAGVNDAFIGGVIDRNKQNKDEIGNLIEDGRFKIKTNMPDDIKNFLIQISPLSVEFNSIINDLVRLDVGNIIVNKGTAYHLATNSFTHNGREIVMVDDDKFIWEYKDDQKPAYPFTVTFREFRQLLKQNYVFRPTTAANPSKPKNFGVFPSQSAFEKFEKKKIQERSRRLESGVYKKQNLT